jgi:putative ABC transport system permease protein
MILLRLISWPYVRKHVLRTLLTVAGIVLGVAVFVGMNTANRGVLAAFSRTIDRIAGKTELEVTAGETGFPEDVLDRVQAVPSVRVAVPVIEAIADTNIRGEGSLLILGVDLTGDRSLREYDLESGDDSVVDDPLVFLAQPDSIILSGTFAEKNHVATGDQLTLGTVQGPRRFTVRGIMKSAGLASAFGGNLAVMDIYAAQKMFGRGRTFDRIDVAFRPGRALADGRRELEQELGPGFDVAPPSSRGQQFESMVAGYALMMNVSSLFALVIAMFIIFNSFAIAATERRKEIGILRALGATRMQIVMLFLAESAVAGVIGSLAGLVAGVFIARGIAASIGALIRDVYGLANDPGEVTASLALLASALGIGLVTSVIAALIPARAASRVDPVQALQKGKYQMLSAAEGRARVMAAAAFAAAAIVCLGFSQSRALFYASYAMAILVVLLVSPFLCLGLVRLLRPLLQWLRPIEGTLAADSLMQAPRRTSASVAALMLSVALIVAFAGMARSTYGSLLNWMDAAINPDLFVMPSQDIVARTVRFPSSMSAELASMPGVRTVQTVREARAVFRQMPVMMVAVDISSIARTTRVRVIDGNPAEMFRIAASGKGVLVSDNLAQLQQLKMGELVDLPAPAGLVRLPIVGIVEDYSDQQGTILIDRSVFEQYWRDDSVNFFRVYLAPAASATEVKRQILERYAGQRQVFVLNNDELKTYILKTATQWFALTYVQVAVAVLIAILGIVNMLTVSITDRRRELGVLRAVGGVNNQIRRTIWLEALTTGALGVALGYALGAINLYYALQIVRRDIVGMRLDYEFPVNVALVVIPVMLGAAFLAAVWPAESAVRGSLVEALEYE